MQPVTDYADLDGSQIAYQIIGTGPIDLLITNGFWGAFDVEWDDPMVRLFYEGLTRFARVIRFDRLGTGSSDPVPLDALPPWEAFVEEMECVLDAAGSTRTAVMVIGDNGPPGMLLAATRPERCRALILLNATARFLEDDDYAIGIDPEQVNQVASSSGSTEGWGRGAEGTARLFFPSRADDPEFLQWVARLQRAIASPAAAEQYGRASIVADARSLLDSIHVPTLVMHRVDQPVYPISHGKYLADRIAGARFVELPGGDMMPYWEGPDVVTAALEDFLSEETTARASRRVLAAVLFTDIVESTRRAESVGDDRWRSILDLHDERCRRVLAGYGGRMVKSTGDGVLGTLDGPGRAIRAALELRRELARLDLPIRSGIHTGEIEIRGDDVGGMAVHIAARVMEQAAPGETLVSSTVRDLVVGSGMTFLDRGSHALKGIDGTWQLFAVS
jgi:class 3 adenylate cyclase